MANVQLEDGYTMIANELLEAIYRISLSDYEHRVFWFIVRKTYGYKKKIDWIAQKQIVEETGISKSHVSETIKKLKNKNMITREGKKIGIQKDYDNWKFLKQVTFNRNKKFLKEGIEVPDSSNQVPDTRNKKFPIQGDTKEIKETIQKKLIQKKNYFSEFVLLTKEEHQKLISSLGKDKTNEMINRLNDYIGQIGVAEANKKYVSHYHTILNWVRKDVKEENKKKIEGKKYRSV